MSAAIEPFVQDLLDALGLDDASVNRLQIDCRVGQPAVVTVTRFAIGGWPEKLVSRYRLVPQGCADPADGLPDDENIGSC